MDWKYKLYGTLAVAVVLISSAGSSAGATDSKAVSRQKSEQILRDILSKVPGLHFAPSIPMNFPIPQYTSNVVKTHFSNTTQGTPAATAVIVSKDKMKPVFDWYVDAVRRGGWAFQTPSDKAMNQIGRLGKLYIIRAEKGKERLGIYLTPDIPTGGTQVAISWTKVKPK